jgi:hypothetical protein
MFIPASSSGPHEILMDLLKANRGTLEQWVATFLIPKGILPDGHH